MSMIREKSQYYGQSTRPVTNLSHPVVVNMTLRLIQVDVSETSNTLTTSVWVKYVSSGADVVQGGSERGSLCE